MVVDGDNCTVAEYGDVLDQMGGSPGHFNSFQKERLGWLDYGISPPVVTADLSGNYQLEPFSMQANGVKGVRVLKEVDPATGQRTWYYLETRQAIGFDDWLSGSNYESALYGLVFRLGTENDRDSSFLLDMTPDSQTFDMRDHALPAGANYTDAAAGVTISVNGVSATGATVNVSFGPQSCVRANPSVNLSSSAGDWVVPGTSVSYTASVTNNDSDACADAAFDLATLIPSGWTAGFTDSSISLAPGNSLSTSLTVTSSTAATDGVYDIAATATHGSDTSYTGSDNATYTVMAETGGGNSPPVAVDDDEILVQVQPVVIDVLANDWDPDSDVIRIKAISQGAKGKVVNNGNGTLTYTPGKSFKNSDSFSYEITDEIETATAAVSITLQKSPKGGGKGGGKP